VGNGVDVAQRGEAFAHALFLYARQVDVLHGGVGDFFRIVELGKLFEAWLGDLGDADVRGLADFGVDMGFGKNAKERGFSDLW